MRTSFRVPGTDVALTFERDAQGRITRVAKDDVCYLDASVPGETSFGEGFVRTRLVEMPDALLRSVTANDCTWTESYRWDDSRRMVEVDDVAITYDREHRVVSCCGPGGNWFYGYSGSQLTVIDGPTGLRQVVRDSTGRPERVRESAAGLSREYAIHYDDQGQRLPRSDRPWRWHCDDLGRLWTVTAPDGRVLRTFLWADFECFGRIDGPPGDPLAAVFSLDLTGTPVRIVGRGYMRRVPRDAFGESLLNEDGVPGLFGGAVDGSLVRLPFRRLDPRTGSFDAPDPFTGRDEDPRRAKGYAGPLLAEFADAGPYAVARNNPVSLADPTGAISDLWWLIPSALTWSYQNTMASIFGFWLTLDFTPAMILWFLPNLLTLFLIEDLREHNEFRGFFDVEFLTAKNYDAFALRSGGLLDMLQDQTWTYQFLVNDSGKNFTKLQFARLFRPDVPFTPALYGTVLHCVPSNGKAFLLRGQRTPPNGATLTSWGRSGGRAQVAFPGSFEPVFPEGALHFASVMADRVCPQRATIAELTPQAPLLGTATTNRAQGTWPGDLRGAATGQTVALVGTAIEIAKITDVKPSGSNTVANFDTPAQSVVGQTVRLRGLGSRLGEEDLPAQGPRSLSVVGGSTLGYAADDILRVSLGGAVVLGAAVAHFEAIVNVDLPLPASFLSDIKIFQASASGSFDATLLGATQLRINRGAVPAEKDGIVAGGIPTIVKSVDATAKTIVTDRDLSSLGGPNTPVRCRRLTRGGTPIGKRDTAAETAAVVTYEPSVIRTAPTTGFLWCESGTELAARTVTGRAFDGIVISADLPNPAATYHVEQFRPQTSPDISDVLVSTTSVVEFTQQVADKTRAFHVMEFTGPGITAAAPVLVTATSKSGQNLTATVAANSVPAIAASDVVVLGAGGTFEAAVVASVRTVVRFTTSVPGRDTNLEAALLREGPEYGGELADPANLRKVRVRPELNGDRVDLPRFSENELVRVSWGAASPITSARERFYRVTRLDGSTFEGEGDDPIDPAAGPLRVRRLVADDPGTGGSRLGRDGHRPGSPPSPNQIEFAVWNATSFSHQQIVAILGDAPIARRVDFSTSAPIASRDLTLVLVSPTSLEAPIAISAPSLTGAPRSRFTTDFRIDAAHHVEFTDPKTFVAGGTSFLVVPYVEPATTTPGQLKAGSVRVPDDHENAGIANTRREALTDHELTHTLQSARLGPWLFAWWPNWLAELIGELTPIGVDVPKDSQTVGAQYREEDAEIEIASFADVSLDKNQRVQISQDGRTAAIRVRNRRDAIFSLNREDLSALSSAGIRSGAVGVRKQQTGTATAVYEQVTKATEFLTLGGLMNVFSAASYGGIIWLVCRICQAMNARSEVTYSASVTTPTVVTVDEGVTTAALDPETTIAIRKGSNVYLRTIKDVTIQAVTIDRAIPLTGAVELAVYQSAAPVPGDTNKYFPGSAEDRNQPAVIKVPGLALDVDDRVIIRTPGGQSRNTKVTARNQNGTVEVEDPVLVGATATELLVAKLRRDDPFGWIDQFVLDKMHLGFLQYLHDPYGQIHYRARPTSTVGRVFSRSARYLFGTKMWGLPILTGYFWWDNVYRQDEPETSAMEQEASFRSGDTYCPVASLHGTIDTVGDVARYWLTADGGNRDGIADMIVTTGQDAPGVHAQAFHLLSVSTATRTGYSVPDLIATKDDNGRNWTGVASQGWIPIDGDLERSSGSYVTFTRPPQPAAQHTIDARSIGGLNKSRNAQSKGPSGVITSFVVPVPPTKRRVRVAFPQGLQDVSVTVAGAPAAEGAVIRLIPFQTAGISVTPGGARQYRVTVSQPGRAARVPPDALSLQAANVAVGSRDFVEISRFYPVDTADATKVVGIGPMHLATPVHVAVRRMEIEITDQLTVIGGVAIGSPAISEAHAGDTVFLLVPAPPFQTPPPAIVSPVSVNPAITPEPSSDAGRDVLGVGGVAYKIVFNEQEPPEADVAVRFDWRVGTSPADSAAVTATLTLKPHFQLNAASGFVVPHGNTITLESSDGTLMAFQDGGAGVSLDTVQPPTANSMTLRIDASAPPGPRTILVKDVDPARPGRFARRSITVS